MAKKREILFITIRFREYIEKLRYVISSELDANVDLLYVENHLKGVGYALNRLSKGKLEKKIYDDCQRRYYEKVAKKRYDYIFVLVGRGMNVRAFQDFVSRQNRAKKILYLWDEVSMLHEFQSIHKYFDVIYSFDDKDCKKYDLVFRPLFYFDEYLYGGENKKYAFSCTGGYRDYREKILDTLTDIYKESEYNWYYCLDTSKIVMIKRMLQVKTIKIPRYITYNSIGIEEDSGILKQSKCVVDLPFPDQAGLSIKIFQAMAARTKVITTCKEVCKYEFYSPDNICVIDLDKINIPNYFLNSPFYEIGRGVMQKYSASEWVHYIFME